MELWKENMVFHVAITEVKEDIYKQLQEIKEAGVNSVKIYTTYAMRLSNEEIIKVMDACSKLDIIVLVHCEEDAIINYCANKEGYENTRPVEAEQNMVNTIVNFSRLTGCAVYICHISCKESIEIIRKAKAQGIEVYAETCPQYLVLNDSKYKLDEREITKYIFISSS